MSLGALLKQQVVKKFQHNYVRFEALLGQISLQPHAIQNGCLNGKSALQHFLLRCTSGSLKACSSNGHGGPLVQNGKHPPAGGNIFLHSLSAEVDRLQLFIAAHLHELWAQLLEHIRQLQCLPAAAGPGGNVASAAGVLQTMEAKLDAIGEDLCLLEQFGRQNVLACAHLAQLWDKRGDAGAEVEGSYLACMEHCLLGEGLLDPLLVGLSDTYELLRSLQSDAHGTRSKWVPPEQFQRLTRKFWLQPADVMRFKCQVIKHLPILIFGDRQKMTDLDASFSVAFLSDQRAVRDSGLISSVYYDNAEELNSYHTRLRKQDRATAVRVRWYGERHQGGDQQLFVERKLHRDSWSGFFSSKDRAPLQQRYLTDYMAGVGTPPSMEGGSSKADLLREVQEYVSGHKQEPLLRTVYRRTAFQKTTDNIVRISLDADMQIIGELGAPRAPGDWCRDMGMPLGPDEALQFPYGVVEIKLQAKPPPWIKELVRSGILLPLPRFSKFLHGVGVLYQGLTDQLPSWFLPDEADPALMTPATWEEMADTSDEHLKNAAAWLFPPSFDPPPAGKPMLSFLRRNKTMPPPAAPKGTSRSAAAATARALTGFELACERLPEAEDVNSPGGTNHGSSTAAPAVSQPGQQTYQNGATILPGAAAPAGLAQPAAPAGEECNGAVSRTLTWPAYKDTSSAAPSHGTAGGGSFLPASYAALGFAAAGSSAAPGAASHSVHAVSDPLLQRGPGGLAPPAGCSAVQREVQHESLRADIDQDLPGRRQPERSEDSNGSTPVDSAQDIESGKASEDDKLPPQQLGMQQRVPTTNAFGSQLYKQMSCRGGGGGAEDGGGDCSKGAALKAPSRTAALVRTRVEPKTFFANERTFLQWLQISVLVMMIAFGLLSGSLVSTTLGSATGSGRASGCPAGDNSCTASKVSGAIIAPVALLFMGYSLYMYKKRTIQILRRETVRYDDQRGPVALVTILLVVMITAYVISMIWIF